MNIYPNNTKNFVNYIRTELAKTNSLCPWAFDASEFLTRPISVNARFYQQS